jgi:hypothetical protein
LGAQGIENIPLIDRRRRVDYRTRRDRTQRRNEAFARVLPDMIQQYMSWKAHRGDGGWGNVSVEPLPQDAVILEELSVRVVDIFGMSSFTAALYIL